MIKNIAITLCTLFLFAALSWTTIAASPVDTTQELQPAIEYVLPYPGILPDSSLYPLKAFRDKAVSMFISDVQKQAKFDLLQADKRLVAGEYLLDKKQYNEKLISETISKGENYFEEAIKKTSAAQKEGQPVNDLLNTLTTASKKHQQILLMMAGKAHGQLRNDLLADSKRVHELENRVSKLMLEK